MPHNLEPACPWTSGPCRTGRLVTHTLAAWPARPSSLPTRPACGHFVPSSYPDARCLARSGGTPRHQHMPSCCTVTITYVDNDLPVARGACGRLPGLRRKASSAPSSTEEAMMAAAAAAAPAAEPGRSGHRPSRLFLNPSHAPSRGGALPDSRGARAVPPSPSDGITAPSMACRGRLPVPGAVFGQRAPTVPNCFRRFVSGRLGCQSPKRHYRIRFTPAHPIPGRNFVESHRMLQPPRFLAANPPKAGSLLTFPMQIHERSHTHARG